MSLQFIIGSSGAGKSYFAYERVIRESMEHPERNYYIIVPEQFTMQTQKGSGRYGKKHGAAENGAAAQKGTCLSGKPDE